MKLDWGDGSYETMGQQLEPVALRLVEAAEVRAGERVLDLGCGSGNAALAAARQGASVTAVDPSARLLDMARARADRAGLSIAFLEGEGARIGVADHTFDVLLAVFSVIFAEDPTAAVREMMRVVRPGGRLLVTSWVPEGAISEAGALLFEDAGPPRRTAWADPAAIRALWADFAVPVAISEESIAFRAESPEAWFADVEAHHPVWRTVRAQRPERWEEIRRRTLGILREGNEDPAAFCATSRYRVVRIDVPSAIAPTV